MDLLTKTINGFRQWQSYCRKKRWMNERAKPGEMYEPTKAEHILNTLSHAIMIIPSIIAGEVLLYTALNVKADDVDVISDVCNETLIKRNIDYEVSARTYTASFVALFITSATFHWISWTRCIQKQVHHTPNLCCCGTELWEFFHMCDRTVIFVFIAGSYTPWMLLADIPSHVEWLRWGIWLYVLMGTAYSYIFLEKYKLLETIIYVIIGLLPAIALAQSLPPHQQASLETLKLGGFFYMSGVFIFKSDGFIPFAHAIWHMFVVFGAMAHFYSIYMHLFYPALYL